jgi:hypothetical protein
MDEKIGRKTIIHRHCESSGIGSQKCARSSPGARVTDQEQQRGLNAAVAPRAVSSARRYSSGKRYGKGTDYEAPDIRSSARKI